MDLSPDILKRVVPFHEQVRQAIRRAILDGTISSEEDLVERVLAERLGVSRTPVREALRSLEQEGLIVPGRRGYTVRRVTAKEVFEAYACRAVLEGMAARCFCERATPSDLAELESLVEENLRALEAHDIDEIVRTNTAFHDLVVKRSGNARLIELVGHLLLYVTFYRRQLRNMVPKSEELSEQYLHSVRETVCDHKRFLEIVRSGDADLAETYMKEHVLRAAKHAEVMLRVLESEGMLVKGMSADA